MQFYAHQALAPNTRRLYSVGETHFRNFCALHQRPPIPASEQTLAEFIVYLAEVAKCAPTTIKSYLAAVRNLHVEHGAGDPFLYTTLPDHVLRGVKRTHGTHSRLRRLPITLAILRKLLGHLRQRGDRPEALKFAAACSLAFFGFLRTNELLALQRKDIDVQPDHLVVHIKASKTDPFRRGCNIIVGKAAMPDICPVGLTQLHLESTSNNQPSDLQPVFQTASRPLSREEFVESLQVALKQCGVDNAGDYKGHSFRIGAATTAGEAGVPDWLIKTMGRWTSSAYQTYIRTDPRTVAEVSHLLTQR